LLGQTENPGSSEVLEKVSEIVLEMSPAMTSAGLFHRQSPSRLQNLLRSFYRRQTCGSSMGRFNVAVFDGHHSESYLSHSVCELLLGD
jgi:hypothetical protein